MEFFIYDGAILFTRTPDNGSAQICIMKEPHIIQIFKDFLLHTSYYKLIYTVEETTELFPEKYHPADWAVIGLISADI